MNIKIIRYRRTPQTIDGHLYIDGYRICDTAENVQGAIPEGSYPIAIVKCKQHKRKMPLCVTDKDMPPCEQCSSLGHVCINTNMPVRCPIISPGNGVYSRDDGSILVGTHLVPGCLTHSKQAFDTLYDRLRKAAERGHEITLSIVEVKG